MNRQLFFHEINQTLFHGKMNDSQRNGIVHKLKAFDKFGITDNRWQAYMLATSYHETAKTMQPVEEIGKGRGKPYGKKLKCNRKPYTWPDKLYYGRGDVQLTWYENYEKMGILLNLPLLEHPEIALEPGISAQILVEGMTRGKSNRGDFTGVSLETYFNSINNDPVHARKIVNGLDQANKIAGYHHQFLNAIIIAS